MRANIVQILKATLAAVIFSLACVLAFSLVMQLFSLSASAVKPVNQVIKILAIAAGGVLFIRGSGGLVKGAVYGALSVIVTFLLFSAIAGAISISALFFAEIFIGAAAGAVSGVIGVNIRGRG